MRWESGEFAGDGRPKEQTWRNVAATACTLAGVALTVTPTETPRYCTFFRASDRAILHHEGWSPARERPIRFMPVDPIIPPGDGVLWRYRAWSPNPVTITAELQWEAGDGM